MDPLSISVISLVAGFLINNAWSAYKERINRKAKLRLINEELSANFHVIHQRKDHIKKIVNYLNEKKILPGKTVNFVTTYYSHYITEIYPHLKSLERNSLHVIYQYFNLIDQEMNNFESDIMTFLSVGIVEKKESVYTIFKNRFQELLNVLKVTEDLISNHVKGNPTDVFYINTDQRPKSFA